MSGKRLLDAARLANAGRAIAKEHFVLRRQQWDLYSETSGLARAVKSQTDRVTITARAAFELAKRFNETGPVWQNQSEPHAEESQRGSTAGHGFENDSQGAVVRSQQEEPRSPGRAPSLSSNGDDGTLASLRRRQQQRLAEHQIPAATADTQSTPHDGAGQDTFNERSGAVTPELSSLPRTKLPRHPDHGLPTEEGSISQKFDSDVFPNPSSDVRPSEKDEQPPEGVNVDVFSSPRISRMLGRTSPDHKNPYASRQRAPPQPLPEMVEAEISRQQGATATHSSATHERPGREGGVSSTDDAAVQDLASSIAAEASPQTSSAPEETPHEMRESRVPSSRFGRLWQYGGLATSMAFGAVGESFRRFGGGGGQGSLMLSEGNLNRLVAKLSRMRGAALKMGQMISFQDLKVLPPTINAVLQRVQDSADYMPASQRDQVLIRNLSPEWRERFSHFEEKPFAAASIGQVHKATLKSSGRDVAVKIQYPGVKNSIDSDLNNLSLLLTASQLLPRGMYLDKTIANARLELGWECDYEREAAAQIRFKEKFLVDELDTFTIPTVYSEASGADVLTADFMEGTAVAKINDLTLDERDWIGTQILRLCLRELMEWRFMQTDPNWTNFLYNRKTKKIELLDFGASREFPSRFVEPYVSLLIAASRGDRDSCRELSIELGYLTGQESNEMLKAHVDSILTLAEPFVESAPELYDFEDQTITDRVRANIGLMLRERLAPPPEETYSLHRKLSGAFLLCARLKSKVPARELFRQATKVWNGREEKVKI